MVTQPSQFDKFQASETLSFFFLTVLGEWHSKLTSGTYMHEDKHILYTFDPHVYLCTHTHTKEKQYEASCQSLASHWSFRKLAVAERSLVKGCAPRWGARRRYQRVSIGSGFLDTLLLTCPSSCMLSLPYSYTNTQGAPAQLLLSPSQSSQHAGAKGLCGIFQESSLLTLRYFGFLQVDSDSLLEHTPNFPCHQNMLFRIRSAQDEATS